MKKGAFLITAVCLFFACAVPAYALDWSPQIYKMPYVVYDTKVWYDIFFKSVKITLGAIGNTGVLIFGVITSVVMIFSFGSHLLNNWLNFKFAVIKRQQQRRVKAADIKQNYNEIIEEKVRDMEINTSARWVFRTRHPTYDMEEKIYQRQQSFAADIEFARRNPDLAVQKNIASREISFEAQSKFKLANPDHMYGKAVYDRAFSATVDTQFKQKYENEIFLNREATESLNSHYRDSHPDAKPSVSKSKKKRR